MRNILILILYLFSSYCFSQKTIIYVLDSVPQDDFLLNQTLEKYSIKLIQGRPFDLIENNYKTIDSLEKANRNWLKNLDKDLSNSPTWKNIREQNFKTRENKGEYYEYISFWDFARIKKYKYKFIGIVGSRRELVQKETKYRRNGSIRN